MSRTRESARSLSAADFLQRAALAGTRTARAKWARRGLALEEDALDPDTQVLLLRQLYLAHIDGRRFSDARAVAEQMTAVGALPEVAFADLSRAHQALGDLESAIAAQRAAARHAPTVRRSFHLWSLATLLYFHGDVESALRSLKRAERWARGDRPLIRAQAAYVALSSGMAVEGLDAILSDLSKSRAREGYGQWLLGMIAHELGDRRRASVHLRTFLRRLASADVAKAVSLSEELRRARAILARFDDTTV